MKDILISDFSDSHFTKGFQLYFDELGIQVTDWDEMFRMMNEEKDNKAFVRITDDNEVIGFIQFTPIELSNWFFSERMGFIREFWIDNRHRNMGHGSALLLLAETYFRENGLYKAVLTTDTANRFYEAKGYKKDTTINAKNNDDVFVKELK